MNKRRHFYNATIIFLAAILSTAGIAAADVTEEEIVERTVDLASSGLVEVDTRNGSIKVETWDRSEVQVVAKKKARGDSSSEARELLAETEVRVDGGTGRVEIAAETPQRRSGWFGSSGSVSVSFQLTIPSDAELVANSHNGSIEIRDLGGQARVGTHNGSIKIDGVDGSLEAKSNNGTINARNIRGAVKADTTNGSIKAEITTPDLDDSVEMSTTNGSVELRLEPGVAASVYARTRNGSVSSDFDGGSQDRRRRTLDQDINGGGARIELESTNGSIRIREN